MTSATRKLIPLTLILLTCLAGHAAAQPDVVQTDNYDQAMMVVELLDPLGSSELITFKGSAMLQTSFEGPRAGDADDSDRNGRDEVDTELTLLNLLGNSANYGLIPLSLHSAHRSVGQLEERTNAVFGRLDLSPFTPEHAAESFFDVYYELRLGPQLLHTEAALRMSGTLTHLPAAPGNYLDGTGWTALHDANDVPTGFQFRVLRFRPSAVASLAVYEHVVMMLELESPNGLEMVQLNGTGTVATYFEGLGEGQAADDDQDGLDEVSTELVALSLVGTSVTVGPLQFELSTFLPSHGLVVEQIDLIPGLLDISPHTPNGAADSFFNVFFRLDASSSGFINNLPHRVEGPLTNLPAHPSDALAGGALVPLFTQNGEPTPLRAGVDHLLLNPPVEVDHFENVILDLLLIAPTGGQESITLYGSATIETLFEGELEGDADDDNGNLLDEVSTELVSLDLTGTGETGIVHVNLNSQFRSTGVIEELVEIRPGWLDLSPFTEEGLADSFFDVFVEVDLGTEPWANATPHRIGGRISHKPAAPQDELYGLAPVDLLDGLGRPTGFRFRFERLQFGVIAVAVEPHTPPTPRSPILSAAPNPFNPRVEISWRIVHAGPGSLRVFDSRGHLVRILYEGQILAGTRALVWDGRDARGRSVVSGTYHLQLNTKEGVATRKVTLVR